MKKNHFEEITARILTELKEGSAPWVRPWKNGEARPAALPHNAATGRPYNGGNVFLLWLIMGNHPDWTHPAFLTYKQAQELGGNVIKGQTGTPIYYYNFFEKKDASGEVAGRIPFVKSSTVFNVAQCENLDPEKIKLYDQKRPLIEDGGSLAEFYGYVDAFVAHGGNKACYIPSVDRIEMPEMSQFESEAHYHSTRLHETAHWTGHKTRLNRNFSGRFGDSSYAAEELVAELTAALLCAELGVEGNLRHTDYIATWIKLLENHEKAFFTAASAAQKAVEFIRNKVNAAPASASTEEVEIEVELEMAA